jgi:hypothetical protein
LSEFETKDEPVLIAPALYLPNALVPLKALCLDKLYGS